MPWQEIHQENSSSSSGEVTSDGWCHVLFPRLHVMSGDTGLMHLPQGSSFASNPIQVCQALWHKVIVVPAIIDSSFLPMGTIKTLNCLESSLASVLSLVSCPS